MTPAFTFFDYFFNFTKHSVRFCESCLFRNPELEPVPALIGFCLSHPGPFGKSATLFEVVATCCQKSCQMTFPNCQNSNSARTLRDDFACLPGRIFGSFLESKKVSGSPSWSLNSPSCTKVCQTCFSEQRSIIRSVSVLLVALAG